MTPKLIPLVVYIFWSYGAVRVVGRKYLGPVLPSSMATNGTEG